MILKVFHDNGEVSQHSTDKKHFNKETPTHILKINSNKKEETFLQLVQAYYSNQKTILYDKSNKLIEASLNSITMELFNQSDASMLFFTSGTTGHPVGAFKSKENLEKEVRVLSEVLKKYHIKRVIVTVPFLHIYGLLTGFLYPLMNDLEIVLKEHFLPNDLLNCIEENSLIVTTPLYIKALNKLSKDINLNHSLFVSSTAPLDAKSAKEFNKKYNSDILQLFGSTETGGIAYKFNDSDLWTPLETVHLNTNLENELTVSSPFVSLNLFEQVLKQTKGKIQTFDYVEFRNNQFKLIGRSSQVLKISGKRYSTVQIEDILEKHDEINKAIVFVKGKKESLRDEVLDITIEATRNFTVKEIRIILKQELSNLKFSFDLKQVDKIEVTNVGKKKRVF